MEKKMLLQCDGRTDYQTVREFRGGQGRGGEKIVK